MTCDAHGHSCACASITAGSVRPASTVWLAMMPAISGRIAAQLAAMM